MALSFRYIEYRRGLPLPLIPVIFLDRASSDPTTVGVLVDSGADFTTITETLAKRLDLELKKGAIRTQGIGGSAEVMETTSEVILGIPSEAYRIEIPVHVITENGDQQLPYPLLGRTGVFDHFDISFRQRKLKIDFRRTDETPIRVEFPIKR